MDNSYLAFFCCSQFRLRAIVAFFMVLGARRRLDVIEQRLALFEQRLHRARPLRRCRRTGPCLSAITESARTAVPPQSPKRKFRNPFRRVPRRPPLRAAAKPDRPSAGFEEKFGTRWVVYIGGLALALGGIFLVQIFDRAGPARTGHAHLPRRPACARVWSPPANGCDGRKIGPALPASRPRISRAFSPRPARPSPMRRSTPAYALYGFFGPALAFILLGIVALATLAAALLHGPALAGLGLVGAYRHAAARFIRTSRVTGRSISISPSSPPPPSGSRACACGAGLRSPRLR